MCSGPFGLSMTSLDLLKNTKHGCCMVSSPEYCSYFYADDCLTDTVHIVSLSAQPLPVSAAVSHHTGNTAHETDVLFSDRDALHPR